MPRRGCVRPPTSRRSGRDLEVSDAEALQDARRTLQDAGLRKTILEQGNEVAGGSPQDFAALVKAETPRWAKVVRDAKIDPE